VFLVHRKQDEPTLLLLDNHESHLSLEVLELAKKHGVEFFGLPPHTTHLFQPLDVALFKPLKTKFSTLAMNLGYANKNLVIGKQRYEKDKRNSNLI
jgi:hypothetical protein